MLELITWPKLDLIESANRVKLEAWRVGIHPGIRVEVDFEGHTRWRRRPRGRIIVDEVGLGAGVLDPLRQSVWSGPNAELVFQVDAFNSSLRPRRSRDRAKYLNSRAAAYWKLRELLEQGKIALPRSEKLFDELVAIQYTRTGEGKIQIEPNEQLKKRLGRSPDRADAVVMAFSDPPPSRQVRVFTMSFYF